MKGLFSKPHRRGLQPTASPRHGQAQERPRARADRHRHEQAVWASQRARDLVQESGRRRQVDRRGQAHQGEAQVPSGQGGRGDRAYPTMRSTHARRGSRVRPGGRGGEGRADRAEQTTARGGVEAAARQRDQRPPGIVRARLAFPWDQLRRFHGCGGIDAPEMRQTCADGWPVGLETTAAMRKLIEGRAPPANSAAKSGTSARSAYAGRTARI